MNGVLDAIVMVWFNDGGEETELRISGNGKDDNKKGNQKFSIESISVCKDISTTSKINDDAIKLVK
jgi:hypothetical protein